MPRPTPGSLLRALPRTRLLPVLASVAALVLMTKVASMTDAVAAVWTSNADDRPSVAGSAVTRVSSGSDRTSAPAAAKPGKDHAATGGEGGQAPEGKNEDARRGPKVQCIETSPALQAPPSAAELEVLQQLGQRRTALDQRSADLDRRQDLIRAAEARLDQKVGEMKTLQSELAALIQNHDEQHEAKLRSLVKIYENMKPKDAAQIFEALDDETLLAVAERMTERKLAPVMAVMNPAKAKDITEDLAKQRRVAQQRPKGAT